MVSLCCLEPGYDCLGSLLITVKTFKTRYMLYSIHTRAYACTEKVHVMQVYVRIMHWKTNICDIKVFVRFKLLVWWCLYKCFIFYFRIVRNHRINSWIIQQNYNVVIFWLFVTMLCLYCYKSSFWGKNFLCYTK